MIQEIIPANPVCNSIGGSYGYPELEVPVAAVNPLISRDLVRGCSIFEQQKREFIETRCRYDEPVGLLIEYIMRETQ